MEFGICFILIFGTLEVERIKASSHKLYSVCEVHTSTLSVMIYFMLSFVRHLEEQLMERSLVQIETGVKPLSSVVSE